MLKTSMVAATALLAATFLVQPHAEAAPAVALKGGVESSAVQFVGGRHHGHRWHRGHPRRHGGYRGHHRRHGGYRPHFRGHRLHGYGYRGYGSFRWDGRGFVTRAYHPRHGWVWVRVSSRSGRPLAYWR